MILWPAQRDSKREIDIARAGFQPDIFTYKTLINVRTTGPRKSGISLKEMEIQDASEAVNDRVFRGQDHVQRAHKGSSRT